MVKAGSLSCLSGFQPISEMRNSLIIWISVYVLHPVLGLRFHATSCAPQAMLLHTLKRDKVLESISPKIAFTGQLPRSGLILLGAPKGKWAMEELIDTSMTVFWKYPSPRQFRSR